MRRSRKDANCIDRIREQNMNAVDPRQLQDQRGRRRRRQKASQTLKKLQLNGEQYKDTIENGDVIITTGIDSDGGDTYRFKLSLSIKTKLEQVKASLAQARKDMREQLVTRRTAGLCESSIYFDSSINIMKRSLCAKHSAPMIRISGTGRLSDMLSSDCLLQPMGNQQLLCHATIFGNHLHFWL